MNEDSESEIFVTVASLVVIKQQRQTNATKSFTLDL